MGHKSFNRQPARYSKVSSNTEPSLCTCEMVNCFFGGVTCFYLSAVDIPACLDDETLL